MGDVLAESCIVWYDLRSMWPRYAGCRRAGEMSVFPLVTAPLAAAYRPPPAGHPTYCGPPRQPSTRGAGETGAMKKDGQGWRPGRHFRVHGQPQSFPKPAGKAANKTEVGILLEGSTFILESATLGYLPHRYMLLQLLMKERIT